MEQQRAEPTDDAAGDKYNDIKYVPNCRRPAFN